MEWKTYTVQELIDLGMLFPPMDGNHGGKYPKASEYVDNGVPFVMANNLSDGQVNYETCVYLTKERVNQLDKGFSYPGDVLLTHKATIGRTAIVNDKYPMIMLTPQVTYYRIKGGIDNHYLKYYFDSYTFQNLLQLWAGAGSTRAYLGITAQRKLPIVLPPIDTQRRIAAILSSLDRKIELNNQINKTLEEMAQAIFKNWFVDFGPFQDGEFVESELGLIPKGWRVVTLGDITSKFGTGLNPRKNFKLGMGDNFYVTIKNMQNNRVVLDNKCDKIDDTALEIIQKRSKLKKGDLLFSGIGTIGRVAIVVDDPKNWNTSESVFNMHPGKGFSTEFLYLLLQSQGLQEYVRMNAQGAVQQGIRMASLKDYHFACPPQDTLNKFDNLIKYYICQKNTIEKQNDCLMELRDTLLPKLMSGEIEL